MFDVFYLTNRFFSSDRSYPFHNLWHCSSTSVCDVMQQWSHAFRRTTSGKKRFSQPQYGTWQYGSRKAKGVLGCYDSQSEDEKYVFQALLNSTEYVDSSVSKCYIAEIDYEPRRPQSQMLTTQCIPPCQAVAINLFRGVLFSSFSSLSFLLPFSLPRLPFFRFPFLCLSFHREAAPSNPAVGPRGALLAFQRGSGQSFGHQRISGVLSGQRTHLVSALLSFCLR